MIKPDKMVIAMIRRSRPNVQFSKAIPTRAMIANKERTRGIVRGAGAGIARRHIAGDLDRAGFAGRQPMPARRIDDAQGDAG